MDSGSLATYFCPVCNLSFTAKAKLNQHMRVDHAGLRPYQCTECEFNTNTLSNLTRHVQSVHLRLANHQCMICGRRFNQSGNLHRHVKTHTAQKPYICGNCGKGFQDHSSVKDHHSQCIISRPRLFFDSYTQSTISDSYGSASDLIKQRNWTLNCGQALSPTVKPIPVRVNARKSSFVPIRMGIPSSRENGESSSWSFNGVHIQGFRGEGIDDLAKENSFKYRNSFSSDYSAFAPVLQKGKNTLQNKVEEAQDLMKTELLKISSDPLSPPLLTNTSRNDAAGCNRTSRSSSESELDVSFKQRMCYEDIDLSLSHEEMERTTSPIVTREEPHDFFPVGIHDDSPIATS